MAAKVKKAAAKSVKGSSKKVSTKAPTNSSKTKTKKPATKKVEKVLVVKDWYGSRPGTQTHAINACLGAKPKTTREILEEAGLEEHLIGRLGSHLNTLRVKGHIERTENGWVRVGAKPTSKKRRKVA